MNSIDIRSIDETFFRGKTAVVTGAASGMGLETSRRLAAAGAKVLMADAAEEALARAAAELRDAGGAVEPAVCDVRVWPQVEAAAKTALDFFGRIDLLLCFAGGNEARCCASRRPFYEQPVEVIDWGLDVNLKGAVYFARACMPAMVAQKSGVIVCLGSVTGHSGDGSGSCYGAAKSGIVGLVKGLARAGAPHGVRAVAVSPGPVLTRPGMAAMPTLLGRAAEVRELVDVILFLCSDRASFVTGSELLVDGGHTLLP